MEDDQVATPQTGVPSNAPVPNDEVSPAHSDTSSASSFNVPDGYKEKGWAKNISSEEDLWKMLDNSQEMIGKKHIIPDLSDETSREEYFSQLRPESPNEYGLPDEYGEEVKNYYSNAFHKAGLSKEQAQSLVEMHSQLEQQSSLEMYGKEAFQAKLQETFGDGYEKESNKILSHMKTMMTPEQKKVFETAPNDSVIMMMQYTKKMMEEYGANEGTANSGNNTTTAQTGQESKAQRDDLYKQLQELSKRPHSAQEKRELMNKYTSTFR